jgi:L,D-transpeptidase catalytic domain
MTVERLDLVMDKIQVSRRQMLIAAGTAALLPSQALGFAVPRFDPVSPSLMTRARNAMEKHRSTLKAMDRVAVVDYSLPSRVPRMFIVDTASGLSQSFLVAHGRGSDPSHSGWLEHFSNDPGSEATSAGAYLSSEFYEGKHGRSQRMIGLDYTNYNAESRAIVIHAASYVGSEVIKIQGKLGRSEGCLAVSQTDIATVLEALGPGRLIYVDRVKPWDRV